MGLRGSKSLRRKVRYIKRNLGDEVSDAVRKNAEAAAKEAQRNVATQNSVWQGDLYRSISAEREASAHEARWKIIADVPYAAFVEFGTGARGDESAPLKFQFASASEEDKGVLLGNITEWVMTKPVFFGPRTVGVAAAITDKIIEQGTYAQPYLRPAWFTIKPALIRDAGYAARRVVRRA